MRVRLSRLALALTLAACGDDATHDTVDSGDDSSDAAAETTVVVRWPSSYAEEFAASVSLVVTPVGGAPVTIITDAMGRVTLPAEASGTITGTIALTEGRAESLTGHRGAIELTTQADFAAGAREVALVLDGPPLGDFLIEEVSYTGAIGLTADEHYFHDQFIEIYNNSTHELFADGLLIADVHGAAGEINPSQPVTPFAADPDHVYVNSIWRIPGGGTDVPVPPGGSIVIAHDGTNHQPQSTVDMTDADWESFNERPDGRDIDYPTVPNLERVRFEGGFDWLLPVFGPGVVLLRGDNVDALETATTGFSDATKVPLAWVVDAFEALMDADAGAYKRVPVAVDRGFVYSAGTYVGQSAIRRVRTHVGERAVLQDENDSGGDFEVVAQPQPRVVR